jgi:tRNA 2-thiouridine synthesizing protein C
MKSYLFIFSHSPYQNYTALESLELALAISSFNQKVAILFTGAGVKQLLSNQTAADLGFKDFTKAYQGLSLFDIYDVYVDQASLATVGDAELLLQPQVVDEIKVQELRRTHDIVIEC